MKVASKVLCTAATLWHASAVRVDDDASQEADDKRTGVLGWAIREGVDDAKHMQAGRFPKGPDGFMVRGVSSTKAFKKGDVVLTVKPELLMWSHGKHAIENLKTAGTPASFLDIDCEKHDLTPEHCGKFRLTAGLLQIKKNQAGSQWDGYVANLPEWKDFQMYHPLAADESLLESFSELPALAAVKNQRRGTLDRYKLYKDLGGQATEEEYKWGDLVVTAYAWSGHANQGSMLVPLGDAFNTGTGNHVNVVEAMGDPDAGVPFTFTATRDIGAGEEIVDFYSDINDDSFTAVWGFPLAGKEMNQLSQSSCKELSRVVGGAVTAPDGKCTPPESVTQIGTFCTLSRLSLEHCKEVL